MRIGKQTGKCGLKIDTDKAVKSTMVEWKEAPIEFEGLYVKDENQYKYKYTIRRNGSVYLKSMSKSMADLVITDKEVYNHFETVKKGAVLYMGIK
jgi:hypothetical protein